MQSKGDRLRPTAATMELVLTSAFALHQYHTRQNTQASLQVADEGWCETVTPEREGEAEEPWIPPWAQSPTRPASWSSEGNVHQRSCVETEPRARAPSPWLRTVCTYQREHVGTAGEAALGTGTEKSTGPAQWRGDSPSVLTRPRESRRDTRTAMPAT